MGRAATKVGSVELSKVNSEIVDKYLVKYGLSTDGTLAQRVGRLVDQQAKIGKAFIGDCDNCGGACDVREPECVFCGVGDEAPTADVADVEVDTVEQLVESSGADSSVTDAADESDAPEADANGESVDADPVIESDPECEIVEPPITPVKRGRGRPKKLVELKVETTEPPPVDPSAAITVTEADLNQNVAHIHELRRDAVVSYWRLGKAIYDNFAGRMYTQRLDAEGKPKYKSFSQFVSDELHLSTQHAYALMDVAVNFTEDDVSTIGVAKLMLVARLPPGDRTELLEKIRSENPAVSEVADEVRRLAGGGKRASSAATIGGGKGFSGDSEKGRAASLAAKSQITVGLMLGKQTIDLMRRNDPDRQAATIAHNPYCEEQHLNGVRTIYRVVAKETGLALMIERVRESDLKPAFGDEPEETEVKSDAAEADATEQPAAEPPKKRGPGRPPKNQATPLDAPAKKRGPGRPRKAK